MALLGLKTMVIVAGAFILLGFHFYKPAPVGMENASEYTFLLSCDKILSEIINAMHVLGIKDKRIALQGFVKSFPMVLLEKDDPDVKVSELNFNGVPVLVYEPRHKKISDALPALLFVHGGGYTLGSPTMAQPFLMKLVKDTGMVGISVKYRLAPQNPYPAALEDCEAASRYVFNNAEVLGINPEQIGIAGDSAGGNMAAVLSQKFRDMGGDPQFMYQVLIYPWVQAVNVHLPSFQAKTPHTMQGLRKGGIAMISLTYGGFPLSNIDKVVNGQHISTKSRKRISEYLSLDNIPSDYIHDGYTPYNFKKITNVNSNIENFYLDPYAWPLMAESLVDLPPALVVTMGYDTLRDEGVMYLKRLKDDGVEAEHYHDEQGFHAVFNMADTPNKYKAGVRLHERLIAYVRQHLHM